MSKMSKQRLDCNDISKLMYTKMSPKERKAKIKEIEDELEIRAERSIEKGKERDIPLQDRMYNMNFYNLTDIRTTCIYNHMTFTNPDKTPNQTIRHIIHNFPFNMETLSLNKFLRIPIDSENPRQLSVASACTWADVQRPDAIHAIHVSQYTNVKKITLQHKELGDVFSKEIDEDSDDYQPEFGIPLAFSYTNPEVMFYDYRHGKDVERLSVIPCMQRFDASGDWTFVLEPEDPSRKASAIAILSITYVNPYYYYKQSDLKKSLCPSRQVKKIRPIVYYVNGKEITAPIHAPPPLTDGEEPSDDEDETAQLREIRDKLKKDGFFESDGCCIM